MSGRRRWPAEVLGLFAASAIFALAALAVLRPAWQQGATHVTPDPGDPLFNVWILDWVRQALPRGFETVLSPPMFFPSPDVLTYSDHFLGLGVLLAAFDSALPGPLATYNVLLILSFILPAISMAWVLRRGRASWAAATLGGLLFAWAPIRTDHLSHLQVLWAPALPLVLWTFDQLLEQPSWRRRLAFLLCYALHYTGGAYLAYMVHLALAAILLVRLRGRLREWFHGWRLWLPTALASALLFAAFFAPYVAGKREPAMRRSPGEIRFFSATLVSWAQPSAHAWYREAWPPRLDRGENSLFPGFVAGALTLLWWRRRARPSLIEAPQAAGGVWALLDRVALSRPAARRAGWSGLVAALVAADFFTWLPGWPHRPWPQPREVYGCLLVVALAALWALRREIFGRLRSFAFADPWERGLAWAAALCALACLPILFIPMTRFLPGLEGMRVPTRFWLVAIVPLTVFATRALDELTARWSGPRRAAAFFAAFAALAIDLTPRPLSSTEMPPPAGDLAAIYARVAADPAVRAVIELPLQPDFTAELPYLWGQMSYDKPLVNGYSGYEPAWQYRLRRTLGRQGTPRFPSEKTLAELRQAGVTHLIVHRPAMRKRRDLATIQDLERRGLLAEVAAAGRVRLFAILPGRRLDGRSGRGVL